MDDVGAVPPSLGHHPARCPYIPGGLRQGTGGRQRTRRIVDENLRDLLSARTSSARSRSTTSSSPPATRYLLCTCRMRT